MRTYHLSTAYTDSHNQTHYLVIDLEEDHPIVQLLLDDTHSSANELTLHYSDHTYTRYILMTADTPLNLEEAHCTECSDTGITKGEQLICLNCDKGQELLQEELEAGHSSIVIRSPRE